MESVVEVNFSDFLDALKWFQQERSGVIVLRGDELENIRRFVYHLGIVFARHGLHTHIYTPDHFLDSMVTQLIERDRRCVGCPPCSLESGFLNFI
jgi:hypothetical protein